MTSSLVLHREHGIRYQIADASWSTPVTARLGESFAHEPMTSTLGVPAPEFARLAALFVPECLGNNLSVVAVADDGSEQLAGVLITRDFKSAMPAGIPDDFPWFLPIYKALVEVDSAYERARPNLRLGDALDLWMLGVDGERFGKRGIGGHLVRIVCDLARERGFRRSVAECTGHYSQTIAQRNGFSPIAHVSYKDFDYNGRRVFAEVPPPHTHLVFVEREF